MGKYDFGLDLYDENTITWIADRVMNNSRVLEFGPANGRLTKYLAKYKSCQVDIVEIDENSGKEAALYAVKSYLGEKEGDIENYCWLDTEEKYDYIIFADVLEHLVHPHRVLRRCKKLIKQSGKILVSIPNISHNSIIIELLNDRFPYTSTGILDNTHLRFFTRQSFEQMALDAGWAIVEERAKSIRVGENEIKNSYQDVSKEIFRELAHRPQGDIYQYMFVLSLSEEYLLGNCERVVSLDSTSYYFSEVQYERNGVFDYQKSVSCHFDPFIGEVSTKFTILENSEHAMIKPINCNCVLEDLFIELENKSGKKREASITTNGIGLANRFYFLDRIPEIVCDLSADDISISISARILKYDFQDNVLGDILQRLQNEMMHIEQIKADYETEIDKKNQEFLGSVQIYENEIQRREKELEMEKEDHQREIEMEKEDHQREIEMEKEDHQREIANYARVLEQKEQELHNSIEIYEREIKRREDERQIILKNKVSWSKNVASFLARVNNKVNKKIVKISDGGDSELKVNVNRRKVTAVIPNYNYARFLDERIDSILAQTYPVSEIIILDDCSKDDSIEVIKRRIKENTTNIPMRLICNEKNSGSVFAQWQKAFAVANGDYVWIAEADDSCNERFLETVMKGFEDDEVVLSYCESLTMDENNVLLMGDLRVWIDIFQCGKWDNDYIKDGKAEVAETMCINNTIANVSSAVIRNGDYHEILEQAKAYKLAGDWYTYMNILKRGKIAYFKESLNYHRMQQQGLTLSTSHEKEFEEIVKLQDFALKNFDVKEEVKRKVYERRERERVRFGL